MFGLFIWYYINRIANPGLYLIPTKEAIKAASNSATDEDMKYNVMSKQDLIFWICMNSYFIVMIAFYFLYYARVYESFGIFVRMCIVCLQSIQNFMLFLIFWVIFFAWLYKITGSNVEVDKTKNVEDYKILEGNVMQLLESFRNTLGDVQLPSHVCWDESVKDEEMGTFSIIMVNYIWVIWIIDIVFMCIILLNILIAVLSSAYEDALTDNFALKYSFRTEMAAEACLIQESWKWIIGYERSQIFCLTYSIMKEEEEDDGGGGIKQITSVVNGESKKLRD